MVVTARTEPLIIDLGAPPTGHRLPELLQALTGCSVERAELAVDDPTPAGPTSPSMALDTLARGMAALRGRPGWAPRG